MTGILNNEFVENGVRITSIKMEENVCPERRKRTKSESSSDDDYDDNIPLISK